MGPLPEAKEKGGPSESIGANRGRRVRAHRWKKVGVRELLYEGGGRHAT